MKRIVAAFAICALSQTAIAQTRECKVITDAPARLACYDKTARQAKPAAAKPIAAPASTNDGEYVDAISAEDALMNARLKNICRGC